MKNVFILGLLVFCITQANAQQVVLKNEIIWASLYPNNKSFDAEKRLIRQVQKSGKTVEYRTKIAKILYYTAEKQSKAKVILFSYAVNKDKKIANGHVDAPTFEIATFVNKNNAWAKQNFTENWSGAAGAYGEGALVELGSLNNKKCLVVSTAYTGQGITETYSNYYDLETLKKLKSVKK